MSRVTGVLCAVRGINRTDALALCMSLGSLGAVLGATREQLSACPGIGPTKVRAGGGCGVQRGGRGGRGGRGARGRGARGGCALLCARTLCTWAPVGRGGACWAAGCAPDGGVWGVQAACELRHRRQGAGRCSREHSWPGCRRRAVRACPTATAAVPAGGGGAGEHGGHAGWQCPRGASVQGRRARAHGHADAHSGGGGGAGVGAGS